MDPLTIDTTKIKITKKQPVTALDKLNDTGLISTVLAAREREGLILFSTIDQVFNWARLSSLWPVTSGLACCAIEMMATSMAHHDISRFGMEIFRASPRQADLMFVAGTVTKRMAPRVKILYEMMADP